MEQKKIYINYSMKNLLFIILIFLCSIFIHIVGDGIIPDDIPVTNSYGIIYGNKVNCNGEPSDRLKARLDAGYDLFSRWAMQKIIVSGWFGVEWFAEEKVMKQYLIKRWIKAEDILVDSNGITTQQTSKNVKNLLWSNVTVIGISQFYHISRIKLSLRQQGFQRVYGYAPRYFEIRDIYSTLREIPAYIKYLFSNN